MALAILKDYLTTISKVASGSKHLDNVTTMRELGPVSTALASYIIYSIAIPAIYLAPLFVTKVIEIPMESSSELL